jgi:hypothetical protein
MDHSGKKDKCKFNGLHLYVEVNSTTAWQYQ